MGPEPLIWPLALLGLGCLTFLLLKVALARLRTWWTPVLFISAAITAWGSQGTATWKNTVITFFMGFGVVVAITALFLFGLRWILRKLTVAGASRE